jgi:hypothetical protein
VSDRGGERESERERAREREREKEREREEGSLATVVGKGATPRIYR